MEKYIYKKLGNAMSDRDTSDRLYDDIYRIHKYWSRKPWYVVKKYISKYSNTKDLIFDPFCGSGVIGLESILQNRNFIGQDINPISLKISEATLMTNVDVNALKKEYTIIERRVKTKIMNLYKTNRVCDKCNNNLYYKRVNLGPSRKGKYTAVLKCEFCGKILRDCKLSKEECNKINTKKYNHKSSLSKTVMPVNFLKNRYTSKGIRYLHQMYTNRNFYALQLLKNSISKSKAKYKDLFLIAFTNSVLHASKLNGENVRPLGVNSYWVPEDYVEENVWDLFEERINRIINSKIVLNKRVNTTGNYKLVNKSATKSMGKEKFDYIFTDPPYGEAIQYSELSFLWNTWIGKKYENKDEIIINPKQSKYEREYNAFINKSLLNMYNSLKYNKYITLCFQNKDISIWNNVIETCKKLNLVLIDVKTYNTYKNSFNKNWSKFSPKSDFYITMKKVRRQQKKNNSSQTDINMIIKDIKKYIVRNNIKKDNSVIYDLIVIYLIWNNFTNSEQIDLTELNTKKIIKLY